MGNLKISGARVGPVITNCYFVWDDEAGKMIVIDPGADAQFLEKCIDETGAFPAAILLTHGHYDHIGALSELRDHYNIPVYVHELEVPMIKDGSLNLGGVRYELKEDDVIIHDGDELDIAGLHIRVIHTPGHTPGGVCYYLKDRGVLFSGDTMFRYSWGRTDFPGGSEDAIMHSIRTKLLPLPEDTVVYPGHEGATVIADERKIHGYRDYTD